MHNLRIVVKVSKKSKEKLAAPKIVGWMKAYIDLCRKRHCAKQI